MPLIVKCSSCGFVLYQGKELVDVDYVLRRWGYRCPCCLSPLKPEVKKYEITVNGESSNILGQAPPRSELADHVYNFMKERNIRCLTLPQIEKLIILLLKERKVEIDLFNDLHRADLRRLAVYTTEALRRRYSFYTKYDEDGNIMYCRPEEENENQTQAESVQES